MEEKAKKFDPELFKSTHEYYAKYRPDIEEEVIDIIVKHFNVRPSDRVLDVACGTGQVTLAMEGKCAEMVCLDPDPEMLKLAKKATKDSKIKITWLNYGAEDLGKLKKDVGNFKVATICRAFHWLDQEQVLNDLNNLIKEDGGAAIFSERTFWTGQEEWQQAVKKVVQRYLGEERRAGKGKFKEPESLWEEVLAHSAFKFVKACEVPVVRNWDAESIIGYLFSTSSAAPHLFGDQIDRFKEETKNTLLAINPKGAFQENAVWSIFLGSKKHLF